MTDTIADMLTRIRNAHMAQLSDVAMPFSKMKFEIAKILKEKRFIDRYDKETDEETGRSILTIDLIKNGIHGIDRVSKPGQRIYSDADSLDTSYKQGKGLVIISTSKGLMDSRSARKAKIGGEVICRVW